MAARLPVIVDVRGRGLMVGLELGAPSGGSRAGAPGFAAVSARGRALGATQHPCVCAFGGTRHAPMPFAPLTHHATLAPRHALLARP